MSYFRIIAHLAYGSWQQNHLKCVWGKKILDAQKSFQTKGIQAAGIWCPRTWIFNTCLLWVWCPAVWDCMAGNPLMSHKGRPMAAFFSIILKFCVPPTHPLHQRNVWYGSLLFSTIKKNHMSVPGEWKSWWGIRASLLADWAQFCVSVYKTIQDFL